MEKTLQDYAGKIQKGDVDPTVYYDRNKSGIIFDPHDEKTPFNVLSFGIYQLEQGPFSQQTGDRECVLVPVTAEFRVECGSIVFESSRTGGPFATLPAESNAEAVYIPKDSAFKISGKGEMVFFSAPSSGGRKPCIVKSEQVPLENRGRAFWRRDIVTLVTPDKISTNLVVGETYSPPGLWSGTPLHVHDKDDPQAGQSDHEEVYYHLARYNQGEWGSYGVQLMFNNTGLNKAYVIKDRTAVAIPGAAHPVVAGPVSDMLYIWALGGKEGSLGMWDIPEFKFLKDVEKALDQIESSQPEMVISEEEFESTCQQCNLSERGVSILRSVLGEKGWNIE
ncbi:5-deoxy-glucuronate isomerase [candidate division NPL-UPA2 bacterium]|nr:5-deoxy-glucuronate isomerase [candidate division NPL-UPA2 bacterium]